MASSGYLQYHMWPWCSGFSVARILTIFQAALFLWPSLIQQIRNSLSDGLAPRGNCGKLGCNHQVTDDLCMGCCCFGAFQAKTRANNIFWCNVRGNLDHYDLICIIVGIHTHTPNPNLTTFLEHFNLKILHTLKISVLHRYQVSMYLMVCRLNILRCDTAYFAILTSQLRHP